MTGSDLLQRASARGFRVVRSVSEAGPGPFEPLLDGRAVILGRRGPVVRVLVARPPDRALLLEVERDVEGQVLLEVGTPEVLEALVSGSHSFASVLARCSGFERVLLVDGQSAVGETGGVREEMDLRASTASWPSGVQDAEGVRWRIRRRPSGLVEARRLVSRVPDLSDMSPPAALVEAVGSLSGAFCIVGGPGSGRSTVIASILLRALDRSGVHALALGDPWEHMVRRPGCVVERVDLPWGDRVPEWVGFPEAAPDVLLVDVSCPLDTLPCSAPLVVVTSRSPVEGMVPVSVSRTSGGVRLALAGPVTGG